MQNILRIYLLNITLCSLDLRVFADFYDLGESLQPQSTTRKIFLATESDSKILPITVPLLLSKQGATFHVLRPSPPF